MRGRALYRAAASGRRFSSWDSKLLAGAAFVPAGFSSGTGVCACGERREVIRNAEFGMRNWGAGDERARHCGSVAAVCRRFAHGIAVLLERLAFGSRLSFFLCQEKRDGLRCLAFLFRRVEIAIRAFSLCLYGYLPLAGSLRVCAFLYGDLDGLPGRGERGYGIRGRRRGLCALLCKHISLEMLSAGSTLGLRAPRLRQRVFDSLDSLQGLAE